MKSRGSTPLSVTSVICLMICHICVGQTTIAERQMTTKEPRPRTMEEDELILFNVAAKGRVVELLANELARTEIIRALLVQYAKECVQNVTVLEKHCLDCMMERCENRISECKIKTPPLSDVINHDPVPIPGLQFLSQAPRDVQKHLKDFTSRARTDILEGIPESLRQESETIMHKEVDQSLQDLSDNLDTDKALQTISVHMQKAADNVHKIPELGSRVGTIIIANEGHAINIAELLANRLQESRPFVDSIQHNSQRLAEQMPTIMDHVTETVSVFKDKISGMFSNVLNTFNRIMVQPDTNVINGDTMQGQRGFQPNFNPNMQMSGNFPVNPNVQQFPGPLRIQQQQVPFVNMNEQQLFMQSQFPTETSNVAFSNPLPVVQQFRPGQPQMTVLSLPPIRRLPPFNRPRFPGPPLPGQNTVAPPTQPQAPGNVANQGPQAGAQDQPNVPPRPQVPRRVLNQQQQQQQNFQQQQQQNLQQQQNIQQQQLSQQQQQNLQQQQNMQQQQLSQQQQQQQQSQQLQQQRLQQQNFQQQQLQKLRQQQQSLPNTVPTGSALVPPKMAPQSQALNVNQIPNNPPMMQRNQVQSVQRINDVNVQNQQFQSKPNVMVPGRQKRHTDADCEKLETNPELYCKQYESHCHNCTLEKRLRFEVCGEGVEKAREEIKRLDESVEGYLKAYENYIVGQRLVLKVEMDDGKRLHKTNSYYDAYITAKIGESIVRYKTKMILNSDDTRSSGSQVGDELWEKLWEREIFKEAKRSIIEKPQFSIMGQTQNRKIPSVHSAAHAGGHSTGSLSSVVSSTCLIAGTALSMMVILL